jgi:hypothetical protein
MWDLCYRLEREPHLLSDFQKRRAIKLWSLKCLQQNLQVPLAALGKWGWWYIINTEKFEFCQLLIEAGADINFKSQEGLTPLMQYLEKTNPRLESVKKLVTLGADCNSVDNYGNSAVVRYINRDHDESIVDFLVAKTDPNYLGSKSATFASTLCLQKLKFIVRHLKPRHL